MEIKSGTGVTLFMILVVFTTILSIALVSGHPHHETRRQRSHNHHHHFRSTAAAAAAAATTTVESESEKSDDTLPTTRRRQSSGAESRHRVKNNENHRNKNKHAAAASLDDNYDDDDEDDGRHAYLMRSNHSDEEGTNTNRNSNTNSNSNDSSKPEKVDDEDLALTQAFEKHIRSSNSNFKNVHDVYAYQLPSDLWFIVRYAKTPEGQVEKYMNIVDSITNYLDKLEHGVKTVSVNVKGVETVFRLTSRPRH